MNRFWSHLRYSQFVTALSDTKRSAAPRMFNLIKHFSSCVKCYENTTFSQNKNQCMVCTVSVQTRRNHRSETLIIKERVKGLDKIILHVFQELYIKTWCNIYLDIKHSKQVLQRLDKRDKNKLNENTKIYMARVESLLITCVSFRFSNARTKSKYVL